ncbi:IacB protein [Azospirillum thiophilum]|uniref:IacB protein n=1 Tax=Azospirillum thiophilum TaxID=528244 RepID=A0AAC8ZW82_9PROT|nr:IacB protein [Azospirillum thiophilum]ALG75219.1 IacB protein [Azospirillum thiophilum]KJR62615.1 IacB protein [Azospirillum thiophilum]
MSDKKPLRVLFCIGVNQNFFDATADEAKQVWGAFSAMMRGIGELPGVTVLGNMDDDQIMVGPSANWPWTTYVLADVPDIETVTAACNLFRVTPVGDGTFKLWKYCRVEARVGRELVIPQ